MVNRPQSDMSDFDFDLLTIGAGSGGVAASRYAASAYGARVAICEAGRVGGTCVLRGCVPKKLFMYASQFADAFEDAAGYGWSVGETRFDLARLTAAKNAETERLEGIYRRMLDNAGVTLIEGRAQLVDAHTVEVGGRRIRAQRILIATGGAPRQPSIPGIEMAMTSNEILELTQTPKRLLVLGSGYIALEFASIFAAFGSAVTLAFRADQPLRGFDADIRRRATQALGARGVDLQSGFQPQSLARRGEGYVCIGADGREIEADAVLNALGRAPNTEGLGLAALGVDIAEDGSIVVDGGSRTNLPSVFAIGDVTNRLALTPVAIAEGRALVDTEFGASERRVDHSLVATAVFSTPPIATVGLSEADAEARGHRVRVYESDFRPMKNTLAGRDERSYMKLIVDEYSDQVLGIHMIGADAPEILQSLAIAVTMGAKKSDFDATMAMHPTAAEEFVLMRSPRPG